MKANAEGAGPTADYDDLIIERESQRFIAEINE